MPILLVMLIEVEALAVICFHFPMENYILQENISSYSFSLEVQMKKIHVVKLFFNSTDFYWVSII